MPGSTGRVRSSRASGRVTLSDVAKATGVSAMTVSRALRGERRVQPALAEQITRTAQQMGYVPDPAARALASQKSNQVLVLVPLLSNALFVDVLDAIHRVLFAAGLHPLIGVTHYDPAEEEQLLRTYLPLRPAGLLLTGFDHSPAGQELLDKSGIACVHMMELSQGDGPLSVGFSQEDAGARITMHLLERGYRRIAFCAGQLDARVRQRAQGWKRALQQHGLHDADLEYLWPQPTSMALGAELLGAVRLKDPTVDAIFFCNDDIAQGALLEALRQGIKVPEQVAIVGFNDLAASAQMVPPLTTIRTPRKEIGAESARLLLRLLRNETIDKRQVDLGYELVVRKSS
ncbi:MAG: LacI family DNA-binding transcriptional regulator [Comamonas sp.]|nr:LacI family DNA-binding transcriptional regulator [Comamonas sp.]